MERTILVTGAHGFLGRHTARYFHECGYLVTGLGHGLWKRAEWQRWGLAAWYEADISLEALREFAGTPYAVIHCGGGGSVPFSLENPWLDFQRTVLTTAGVLEFVRVHSPSTRVIYPSSASIYGAASESPITEDCGNAPISPYGVHKTLAEELINEYATHYRVAASIVRFFSVYGCELRKQLLWDACRRLTGPDKVFKGSGTEIRDWLHVQDAAALLAAACRNASTECPVVNGGTGEGVNVRAIVTRCAESLHLNGADVQFSGKPSPGDPFRYIADITRALKWGWAPTRNWNDGVAEYCGWWLQEEAAVRETMAAIR